MAETAQQAGVINMVNFLSYRNASAIHKAHELIQAGKLGHIMHVEASYLQSWLVSKAWGDWEERTSGSGDYPPNMEARAPWETLVSTSLILRLIQSVLWQVYIVRSRPSQMSKARK